MALKNIYNDVITVMRERNWKMPFGIFRLLWHYVGINYILPSMARMAPNKFVPFFHRLRGVEIGEDTFIDRTVIIDEAYPQNISIGKEVRIAAGAVIVSHMRAGRYLREHYLPFHISPVKISDFAFIGTNVSILPGVTIGEGAVIVSGSVVATNIESYVMASGNPAKKIKDLKRIL